MANPVLEIKNLCVNYGAIKALRGIDITVGEGEIVTLIGGNGAGKTTTLSAVSNLQGQIVDGDILFMGNSIKNMKPHAIAALGIAHCMEGRHVFAALSVEENLMMGAYLRKDAAGVAADLEHVYKLFPRLLERKSQMGGTLSGGEQQMLAVARALMQKPKILMMDEPSLGLAPLIVQDIFDTIKRINAEGLPILLVEQNSNAALSIANRGYVLETGTIVLSDSVENLRNNEDVKRSYLGVE